MKESRSTTGSTGRSGAAEVVTITETLYLGPPEAAASHSRLLPVETANDALTVIKSGFYALLPPESWATASDVLTQLGCEPGDIEWLFMVAKR